MVVAVQRQQNLQVAGGTSTVLKFAHGLDQNHPVHTAIMHFAARRQNAVGRRISAPPGPIRTETTPCGASPKSPAQ